MIFTTYKAKIVRMLVAKQEQNKYFSVIRIEIATNQRQICLILVCNDYLFDIETQFSLEVAVKVAVFVRKHQRYRS